MRVSFIYHGLFGNGMEVDLEGELFKLERSLEKVKTLSAWEDLKASEIPIGETPSFQFSDSNEMDIKIEKGYFFRKATQICMVLNSQSLRNPEEIRRRVLTLEAELRHLERSKGF